MPVDQALVDAAKAGDLETVRQRIEAGADVNGANEEGWTPLHGASANGHTEVVEALLRSGADVDKADKKGWTPLFMASWQGQKEVAEVLLRAGADAEKKTKWGKTALQFAREEGHQEIVDLLTNAPKSERGSTPNRFDPVLLSAVTGGDLDTVRRRIEAGADVDSISADKWDRTPLHVASLRGHKEIALFLLRAGADKNKGDKVGNTPLFTAALVGDIDMVELFLRAGADKDKSDQVGNTPLHIAATENHVDVVELLLRAGADKEKTNKKGKTPLQAIGFTQRKVAKLLHNPPPVQNLPPLALSPLRVGGESEVTSTSFESKGDDEVSFDKALFDAADGGDLETVRKRIEAGADVNGANEDGITPLLWASYGGYKDVVEVLLRSGAEVDKAVDEYGETPLHWASHEGQREVVEVLLRAGADAGKKTKDGNTSLQIARENGHQEVVDLLTNAEIISAVATTIPLPQPQQSEQQDLEVDAMREVLSAQQTHKSRSTAQSHAANAESAVLEIDWTTMVNKSGLGSEMERLRRAGLQRAREAEELRRQIQQIDSSVAANRAQIEKHTARLLAIEQRQQAQQSQEEVLQLLQQFPNRLLFYRTLLIMIESVFVSVKAASGGFVGGGGDAGNNAALQSGAKAMRVCGSMLSCLPFGGLLKGGANAAAVGLDMANQQRRDVIINHLARNLTLAESTQVATTVARNLTEAFATQLDNMVRAGVSKRGGRRGSASGPDFNSFLERTCGVSGSLVSAYMSDGVDGAVDHASEFISAGTAFLAGSKQDGVTPFPQVAAEYCFLYVMTALEQTMARETAKEMSDRLVDSVLGIPSDLDIDKDAPIDSSSGQKIRSGARRLLARAGGAIKRGTKAIVSATTGDSEPSRSLAVYLGPPKNGEWRQVPLHALLTRCGLQTRTGQRFTAPHCDVDSFGWCIGEERHAVKRGLRIAQQGSTGARPGVWQQAAVQAQAELFMRRKMANGGQNSPTSSPSGSRRESNSEAPNAFRGFLWGACSEDDCECDEYYGPGKCGMCDHAVMKHKKLGPC